MAARLIARSVFAIAALAALAAGMGVSVGAHREAPGTPLQHDHVLAAYRFAFLPDPAAQPPGLDPAMEALHRALLRAGVPLWALSEMPGMPRDQGSGSISVKRGGTSPVQDLAVVFAILVSLFPRLPRPTRRPIAQLRLPATAAPQWRAVLPLPPPRGLVLP